jgi:hypothetical protein
MILRIGGDAAVTSQQQLCNRSEPRVVKNELLSWKNTSLGVDDCLHEFAIYGCRPIRSDHPFENAVRLFRISDPWYRNFKSSKV